MREILHAHSTIRHFDGDVVGKFICHMMYDGLKFAVTVVAQLTSAEVLLLA